MTVQEFQRLKQAAERARQEADRAAGARAQLLARLKSEHGCDSPEEARRLLEKLQRQKEKQQKVVDKLYQELREEFADRLGG